MEKLEIETMKDMDSAEGKTKTLKCPKCGKKMWSMGFYVTTKITHDIDVMIDEECGVIAAVPEDVKWKDTSPTECNRCGHKGQFKEFVVKEEN